MPAPTDHAVERRRIVFAVWAAIGEYGINATTLRKVATIGEISVGRIQYYFANRDEMLQYSCAAMVGMAVERQGNLEDPGTALFELLTHNVSDAVGYRQGARVWAAFVSQAVVDDQIAKIVVEAQTGLENEISRLLRACGADPVAARGLVALSEGLAQRTLTGALTTQQATAEITRAITAANRHRP